MCGIHDKVGQNTRALLYKHGYDQWTFQIKIYLSILTQNDVCRWVCFFIWTDLGNLGKDLHYINCLPMNHLRWMGSVRMRAKTDEKHNSMNVVWSKKLCVCNTSNNTFLTSNHYIPAKYNFYNIAFFSKKSFPLNKRINMQRSSTGYNWKQSKRVLNKYKDFDVREKQEMDFFT